MTRRLYRCYGCGYLHFITFSCYQCWAVLGTAARRDLFVSILEQVRRSYRFVVVGYVVMPEHVHLLVSEPEHVALPAKGPSRAVQPRRKPRRTPMFS